jgi:hypothetical protein
MATVYPVSTYSLATIAVTVASGSGTPTYIWSAAVPSGAKGKSGILQMFFNLYVNTNFFAGQTFSYGIYVDGVPLAIGDSTTIPYTHTSASPYALSSGGIVRGTNGFHGLNPIVVPVSFSTGASQIQIGISNSSLAMSSVSSASPHITSSVTVSSGTINTTNYIPINTFTTTGQGTYTVPTTVQGGTVQGVFVYLWGCGGGERNTNAGGGGGYTSGFYSCAGGSTLTYVVGGLGTGSISSGGGSSGNTANGGGFSGIFTSAGVAQGNSIAIAGGGGGATPGTGGSSNLGASSGGAGGGLVGIGAFFYTGSVYATGTATYGGSGGSQTGGGNAIETRPGFALLGGGSAGDSGGAGGGYWGGGGGGGGSSGGGGSGYIGGLTSGGYTVLGNQATATITAGTGSNIKAGGPYSATNGLYVASNSPVYPSGGTYGNGSGATGCVVIIPAVGASANQVGVQANIFVV